jgi:coiled-coil domain-containing protein 55
VFDYDGHFDGFQDARKQKIARADEERTERKSRYIQSLIEKQKEREREDAIVYERRLLKERQKEDHLYGDKEKFVTAAYKKKLEEDAKWLAQEKIDDAREAADDVSKKTDLSGFYFNLMSRVRSISRRFPYDRVGVVNADP